MAAGQTTGARASSVLSAAPDLVEPVLGFRAWHVDRLGGLVPMVFQACTWQPGVNRAECHVDTHERHFAPQADCTCGIYALHQLESLSPREATCFGAIAAWGDIQVHPAGFRAELACVLALAARGGGRRHRQRMSDAAERYDVPLVGFEDLTAVGLEHARPLLSAGLGTDEQPQCIPQRVVRGRWPLPTHLHYDPEAHTWAKPEGDTVLVGIATPARAYLSFSPSFVDWATDEVKPGDLLGTVSGRSNGHVKVLSPVAGRIVRYNRLLEWAPQVLRTNPYGSGWVARIEPAAWTRDSNRLLTGAEGVAEYARRLGRCCQGPSPIYVPPKGWRRDPILLPKRGSPAGPDSREKEETCRQLTTFLERHARDDRELGRLLSALGLQVRLELGLPGAAVEVGAPGAGAPRRLVLKTSPATAHALFLGRVDPPRAVALGQIELEGDREAFGAVMSVIKRVFPRYRAWTAKR